MEIGDRFEATTRLGQIETLKYGGKIDDITSYNIALYREDGTWFTVEPEWFNQRKIKVLG